MRPRVRTQWLVLSAALIVLAGLLVAWALSRAVERVQVIQVRTALSAGDTLRADDLAIVGISSDTPVAGLVPASSLSVLVGRQAAIDIASGSLLVTGMWTDAPDLAAGEHSVGAVLKRGAYPSGFARGGLLLAVSLDEELEPVAVRVIDVEFLDDGAVVTTLAVPAASSVAVARLAATDRLVLVGVATQEVAG